MPPSNNRVSYKEIDFDKNIIIQKEFLDAINTTSMKKYVGEGRPFYGGLEDRWKATMLQSPVDKIQLRDFSQCFYADPANTDKLIDKAEDAMKKLYMVARVVMEDRRCDTFCRNEIAFGDAIKNEWGRCNYHTDIGQLTREVVVYGKGMTAVPNPSGEGRIDIAITIGNSSQYGAPGVPTVQQKDATTWFEYCVIAELKYYRGESRNADKVGEQMAHYMTTISEQNRGGQNRIPLACMLLYNVRRKETDIQGDEPNEVYAHWWPGCKSIHQKWPRSDIGEGKFVADPMYDKLLVAKHKTDVIYKKLQIDKDGIIDLVLDKSRNFRPEHWGPYSADIDGNWQDAIAIKKMHRTKNIAGVERALVENKRRYELEQAEIRKQLLAHAQSSSNNGGGSMHDGHDGGSDGGDDDGSDGGGGHNVAVLQAGPVPGNPLVSKDQAGYIRDSGQYLKANDKNKNARHGLDPTNLRGELYYEKKNLYQPGLDWIMMEKDIPSNEQIARLTIDRISKITDVVYCFVAIKYPGHYHDNWVLGRVVQCDSSPEHLSLKITHPGHLPGPTMGVVRAKLQWTDTNLGADANIVPNDDGIYTVDVFNDDPHRGIDTVAWKSYMYIFNSVALSYSDTFENMKTLRMNDLILQKIDALRKEDRREVDMGKEVGINEEGGNYDSGDDGGITDTVVVDAWMFALDEVEECRKALKILSDVQLSANASLEVFEKRERQTNESINEAHVMIANMETTMGQALRGASAGKVVSVDQLSDERRKRIEIVARYTEEITKIKGTLHAKEQDLKECIRLTRVAGERVKQVASERNDLHRRLQTMDTDRDRLTNEQTIQKHNSDLALSNERLNSQKLAKELADLKAVRATGVTDVESDLREKLLDREAKVASLTRQLSSVEKRYNDIVNVNRASQNRPMRGGSGSPPGPAFSYDWYDSEEENAGESDRKQVRRKW